MPEGDTILAASNNLHTVLAGKKLVRGDLNWPSAPPAGISGATILEVEAYAKHMLMRLDNGQTLRTHLRMDGVWRVVRPDSREAQHPSGYVRAAIGTDEWTALGYRLGMLDVFPTVEEARHFAHMGPDILANSFVPTPLLKTTRSDPQRMLAPRLAPGMLYRSKQEQVTECAQRDNRGAITYDLPAQFQRGTWISDDGWRRGIELYSLQDPNRPIGETMLDQSVVSGMGTIYLAEGLFALGINPWRPIKDVDVPKLLATTRSLMVRASQDYPRARIHHVHSRDHEPCHRCRTPLQVGEVGPPLKRRPAFYCPTCQPT